ncbi:HEAT repeat domain-containing protein [Planctomycetota bacterium]
MKNKTKKELLEIIQSQADDKTKRKAKRYLHYMMEKWPDDKLEQSKKDGTDVEREIAKWYLWRRHLDTSYENLLEIIKTSSDEDKVHEAILIIGEKKYTQAFDFLIKLIKETDNYWARAGAVLSLRKLGDKRAAPVLIEQLKNGPSPGYDEDLVYAIEDFDCREILELLVDLFIERPRAALLRLNIYCCIENQDLDNVSEEVITNCCLKLDLAMQEVDDKENSEQLEDLYAVLKQL